MKFPSTSGEDLQQTENIVDLRNKDIDIDIDDQSRKTHRVLGTD